MARRRMSVLRIPVADHDWTPLYSGCWSVWFVWFIWFIWLVSFNQTNKTNQIDQMN